MKAISLWQPWATFIASGAKKIETRSWATSYRGPIAIHAAKRKIMKELRECAEYEEYRAALEVPIQEEEAETEDALRRILKLPYGAIIAVATLKDCIRVENCNRTELHADRGGWCEYDLGNYASGRYGWLLENVRAIEPIPYKGEQGLFEVPDSVIYSATNKE